MVMFSITNITLESSSILLRSFSLRIVSSTKYNTDRSSRSQQKQKLKKAKKKTVDTNNSLPQIQMTSHIISTVQ